MVMILNSPSEIFALWSNKNECTVVINSGGGSRETRKKMRLNHKGMSGRKHSEETKEKIRNTKKARKIFLTG